MKRIDMVGQALRIVDDAWTELRHSPGWGVQDLRNQPALLQLSPEATARRSAVGADLMRRIGLVDETALPHDLAVTLRVAAFQAARWSKESDWYWTVADPSGVGFYGMFAPTSYSGGFLLGNVLTAISALRPEAQGDQDRYLAFVADLARLVGQMRSRTEGQAARGIYMPQVQLRQATQLLRGLQAQTVDQLRPAGTPAFQREVERRVHELVVPAFEGFIEMLGGAYAGHASAEVGIWQYPDGREIYAALVRQHTTLNVEPAEVHQVGLERMARIRADMATVRAEAGFDGDDHAWRAALDQMPRWRASTAAEVTEIFRMYMARIAPKMPAWFSNLPSAPHDAAALPAAQAGSMSFGFYSHPRPDRPEGLYMFNAQNLTARGLFNLGALNYHELVPGHHLHRATEQENTGIHPLRTHSFINAYNEGWAEYAATLAGEMGMYELPEERFGRLVMDAFLTTRLVVDTGMNALGWSLERARDYQRQNSFLSEAEILTETVRYSCDIPGQALAYKLGDTELMRLRGKMRAAMGDAFDIRLFHETVLSSGALPLPLVEAEIDRAIERQAVH